MKKCNQLLQLGANFHGYVLPQYSLYGTVDTTLYICTNVFGYSVGTGRMKALKNGDIIEIKEKHFPLKVWNGYRYEDSSTENYPQIRKAIFEFMKTPKFIRTNTLRCEFKTKKKQRERAEILSICPKIKSHPQPLYGSNSGCYSQSRVDGRGYSLDWEERATPATDSLGFDYEGMSCLWNECQSTKTERKLGLKPTSMTQFEGVTDTEEAKRKDGMKVKQHKIRPTVNSPKAVPEHMCQPEDIHQIIRQMIKLVPQDSSKNYAEKVGTLAYKYIQYHFADKYTQKYDLTHYMPKKLTIKQAGECNVAIMDYSSIKEEYSKEEKMLFSKVRINF